jgi:poly-gamma-glutamate synthesis protein (capsule biosynthesis protein)
VDPGSVESANDVAAALAEARAAGADVVVLALHWGPNMRRVPPEEFRWFARSAIEAGADVVWGTSAHLFQGIEFYRGRVILYDTGDFLDDYAVDPYERNDLSFLFVPKLDAEAQTREVGLIPVAIDDRRTRLASALEERFVVSRMQELCAEFGTRIERARGGAWSAAPAAVDAPLVA